MDVLLSYLMSCWICKISGNDGNIDQSFPKSKMMSPRSELFINIISLSMKESIYRLRLLDYVISVVFP